VASGSGAGWPIAPVSSWDGIPLRYPVGVADLDALVGVGFRAATYRRLPIFLYVGDADEDDPVAGWPAVDRDAVHAITGVSTGPIWPRWTVAGEIHQAAGADAAEIAIYPGVGHTISSDMWADLERFFVDALPEPEPGCSTALALAAVGALAAGRSRAPGRAGARPHPDPKLEGVASRVPR
jgi:hypothetical protein